jgi:plasmid stabilization system protein ParE
MKRTLRVLPDAEMELQSAALWYEDKRRGLGVEFVALVDRALQSILENPEGCPKWRADRQYRQRPLKRFPFMVFFRLDPGTVEIVALAHAKRRPGYWLDRHL